MRTNRSFTVVGMTCDHCVGAVREEIGGVDGVERVDIDLDTGLVTVAATGDIPDDRIAAAVDEAGYELAP